MDVTLGRWVTRADDPTGARASLGRPTWGPGALLADLELRLGLPPIEAPAAERQLALVERARDLARRQPDVFYARSLAVDRAGTGAALLAMRDAMVEAGWRGQPVPGGGARLDALAALEAAGGLPPGHADRVAGVAHELGTVTHPVVDRIALLEPAEVWPGAWRLIFVRLATLGTRIDRARLHLPGAPAGTDLGRAQAALRAAAPVDGQVGLSRDGSLVLLRAPTSWELGDATAAILRALAPAGRAAQALVLRSGDPVPLDAALVAQGLRSQGLATTSTLRPALQVLPLALSLLFTPRDVHRALELLSLPVSPIPARDRHALLGALAEASGIGSRAWLDATAEMSDEVRARIAAWIEPASHPRHEGAPREAVLAAIDRVRAWAAGRRAAGQHAAGQHAAGQHAAGQHGAADDPGAVFAPLLAATSALRAAVVADERDRLRPHELDLLVASCAVASDADHAAEQPGRPDVLDAASGVLAARPVVVVWHAGADPSAAPRDLFRAAERRALAAAGADLPDAAIVLEARAASFRRVVLAATATLVVATPDAHLGEPQPILPVWDEIVARLGLGDAEIATISASARELREGRAVWATRGVAVAGAAEPLDLLAVGARWRVDASTAAAIVASTDRLSASGMEMLLGCPLRFALERAAGLRSARVEMLSDGPLLKGKLGHRLIEELFGAGLLGDAATLAREAPAILERLIAEEAATLHRSGRAAERAQVEAKLLTAARVLAEILAESQLTVESVELSLEAAGDDVALHGRLDLLLRDAAGRPFVLDLKWGSGSYFDKLRHGLALQLAHYAEVVRRAHGLADLPPAAYFSIAGARVIALAGTRVSRATFVAGPPLSDTARAAARTITATRALLRRGTLPATGVGDPKTPLTEALGGGPGLAELPPESACGYCTMDAICGRAWEGMA